MNHRLKTARSFLMRNSPAWLAVEVNRFLANLRAARGALPPKTIATPQKLRPPADDSRWRGQPHWRRIVKVFAILDAARAEGVVSYTALASRVREVTGKGCSRKLISKWKLERGLR